MSTNLKKIGNSEFEVKYNVKGDELNKAKEKALKSLAAKVQIKGFRKGKAPVEIAKDHISPLQLANQTINESINPAYQEILKEHKIRPIAQPNVECTNYKEDEIELTFKIVTEPEVTLGQYKELNIPLQKVSVSKTETDNAIKKLLEDNAELSLKEGPAAMGDTVVFDFKGYINGKEFDGGSADNYSLVLGSNQFVPGFEDQLVGVSAESKKDVIVTFPEQYIKDLAGKEAKFVCIIHEVKTKVIPELNDEFVKSLSYEGVNTVEELRKHETASLLQRKTTDAKNKQFSELLNKVIENSTLEIPERLIQSESAALKQQTIDQITQNGLTYEQYKEITGMNDETLDNNFRENALTRLREYLVLNKIGQVEHLTIARNEVEQYYSNVAKQYGMKLEDVKKTLSPNEQNIISNLYQNKIERFLIANNLEEKKPEVKETNTEETKPAKEKEVKKTTKKTTKKSEKEEVSEDK